MDALLFEIQPPRVPILGAPRLFPVRRIFCVGRNYAEHAREQGHDPEREPPFFFMKPAEAATPGGGRIIVPRDTHSLHHEVELVIALGRGGADLGPDAAQSLVYGYAVGLDLTKRDRQSELKAQGRPWERAKAFDGSAPISAIAPVGSIGHPERGRISLSVNGSLRQEGDIADMIWSPFEILSRLSELWALEPGDLIFTGTPAGVGPLVFGDLLEARIEGVGGLRCEVGSGGEDAAAP